MGQWDGRTVGLWDGRTVGQWDCGTVGLWDWDKEGRVLGLPDFSKRIWVAEAMDAVDCDEAMLLRTIAQFGGINRLVSRYRTLLARTVLRDMRDAPEREYHLVDLGAGGCDIPAWLLQRSRQLGLRLRVTALDSDARTVAWAQRRWAREEGLTVVCAGAEELARFGPVDYVFANHFLHHLPDEAIRPILARVRDVAARGYVLADIRRGAFAYMGVTLLNGLFFRRSFALADGQLSVRKGFLKSELEALLPAGVPAGMAGSSSPAGTAGSGARVETLFPARLAVVGGEVFR